MKRFLFLIIAFISLTLTSCNENVTKYATDSQNYRLGYERGMRQGYDQGYDAAQYNTGYNFLMPTYRQGNGYQMYNSRFNNGGQGGYSDTYGADNYYDNSGKRKPVSTKEKARRKKQSMQDKAKNASKVKSKSNVNSKYKKKAVKKTTFSITKKKKPVRRKSVSITKKRSKKRR